MKGEKRHNKLDLCDTQGKKKPHTHTSKLDVCNRRVQNSKLSMFVQAKIKGENEPLKLDLCYTKSGKKHLKTQSLRQASSRNKKSLSGSYKDVTGEFKIFYFFKCQNKTFNTRSLLYEERKNPHLKTRSLRQVS